MTKAYLLGVIHDATKRRLTYRISTNSIQYANFLKESIKLIGIRSWIYQEGKQRKMWIVEFSRKHLFRYQIVSLSDKIEYIRGYFDAEGGIAKSKKVRYYLYFCQKNKVDLEQVKKYLCDLNIYCGKVHNPSKRKDPDYWRFYIKAKSYNDFAKKIGSNHTEKRQYLRMKI